MAIKDKTGELDRDGMDLIDKCLPAVLRCEVTSGELLDYGGAWLRKLKRAGFDMTRDIRRKPGAGDGSVIFEQEVSQKGKRKSCSLCASFDEC